MERERERKRVEDALSDSVKIEEEHPSHSLVGLEVNGRLDAIRRVLVLPNWPIAPIIVREALVFTVDAEELALCAQLMMIVRAVGDDEDIAFSHRRTERLHQNKQRER